MKHYRLLLPLAMLLFACSPGNLPVEKKVEPAKPIDLPTALQARVAQDNDFAFALLQNTIAENGSVANFFISPLSVSIAFGMVRNGAAGATLDEIDAALRMSGLTDAEINEYYRIMQQSLPAIDPLTQLSLANSIWHDIGFPVLSQFLQTNVTYFDADIRPLDFSQLRAVDTINAWCAQKTNNLIQEPLDVIPPDAVMYLINAIYFKGLWVRPFDAERTYRGDFRTETEAITQANMMHAADTLAYYADAMAQYVDLPYGNGAYSMTVMVPNNGITASDLLGNLSADTWRAIVDGFEEQLIEFHMPRFNVKNNFNFIPVMKRMGINLAFSGSADFSRLSDWSTEISNVIHSTYVAVDEEGTEAAAVTIIEVVNTSVPSYPPVRADHPFLFVIREKSTGVILFIGKIGETEL